MAAGQDEDDTLKFKVSVPEGDLVKPGGSESIAAFSQVDGKWSH